MRLSFTQESDFRQHRDFGQKISATFEFIGAHWRGLGRALLFLVLPAALLQGILTGLVQQQMLASVFSNARTGGPGAGGLNRLAMFSTMGQSPFYWVSIAVGALFVTLLVLTVYGYMACCLRPTPSAEPISVGEVWAVVRAQLLSSFLSYFGIVVLVTIAFFLLIVPGIYLAVVLSIFYVVKVVEGPGFSETVSRCRQLVRDKWWSTCGLLFVMSLLLGVCVAVIGAVVGGLGVAIGGALGLL